MTVISELSKAVTWPITALVLAYIFKKQICKLVDWITSFKKFQYDKLLVDSTLDDAKNAALKNDVKQESEFLKLEALPPRKRILKAWEIIESQIADIAKLYGIDGPLIKGYKPYNYHTVAAKLVNDGFAPVSITSVMQELEKLKNLIANDSVGYINEKQANDYYLLALVVYGHLDHAVNSLKKN